MGELDVPFEKINNEKLVIRDFSPLLLETRMIQLPENYSRYVGGKKEMVAEDYQRFETTLNLYNSDKVETSEKRFYKAAAAIRTQAENNRRHMESNWTDDNPDLSDLTPGQIRDALKVYKIVESSRPSADRNQDLAGLFLHHPKFRREYMQIHATKMATALPVFIERLDSNFVESANNRDDYFQRILYLMEQSMIEATGTFPEQEIDNLSAVMNLQSERIIAPIEYRRNLFATTGIPDFTTLLQDIVDEAVHDGRDVLEAVRREFLERDGLGHQLMRTNQHKFVHGARRDLKLSEGIKRSEHSQTDTEPMDSETRRSILADNDYGIGQCPAVMKVTSSDGSETERPIAYEYAATILRHMPEKFLQAA